MSLLIANAMILTMTGETVTPIQGDLLIEGDLITAVGEVSAEQQAQAEEVIDAQGMVALPGLVNCHNHAAMSILRGFSEDLRLMEWLSQKMWPAEARMTQEDVYLGTLLAAVEMIKSGTSTFADMYVFTDSVAQAVIDSGMRAALTRGMLDAPEGRETRFAEARALFETWNGAGDGRLTVMAGPHGPHTCPPAFLQEVCKLADEFNAPLHIHLAETTEEVEIIRKAYGLTPTEYLKEVGLFDHHVVLAHSVHLTAGDIEILRESKLRGGIAHNPVSNLKLGCGIAPVTEYLRAGLTVGLGTDGPGSATTLDMFEEIKAAAWLQKVQTFDPTALTAAQVLQMATREGAKVLALDSAIGTLEAGKKADVILVDTNAAHLRPHHDLTALLAYSANGADVHTTIVGGEVLMRGRKLTKLDEQGLIGEIEQRAKFITAGI
ncbi:5-methylthioadenosine/S-adenosylhomocysteine deaminase [Tumebacillus sp. BK434]|uniref:amidohydrolase n=1 Tax=Tumebacillus sp. BK434 TaxID=2512169 RepID=UPI001049713D|nr:amidohydrolase [Tumebacillus sp. BK434]TCP58083.1 5-methylthioadenosine/S-adenosylhomocysteine deaminase [Tumebacillus sp. BK434]